MNKKFFSGDSVRQALLQAARHFQVEPEAIAYREVDRRHGFLRGRRRAVIEVDLDQPTRSTDAADEPRPQAPASQSAPERARPEKRREAPPEAPASGERSSERSDTREEVPEPASKPAEPAPRAESETRERTFPTRPPAFAELPPPPPPASPAPAREREEPRERQPVVAEAAAPRMAEPEVAETSEVAKAPEAPEARDTDREAPDVDLAEAARRALGRLFELSRLNLDIERIEQGEEKLEIELRGEDEEYLLEDRGRLLLAFEHLLPRMLRGLTGRSTPVQVDCDDFHEIRTEQLRDLAQRVASEVRNRRRSRTLEPMSPDERRIVHLTLADDPAVETVSQGNGLFKRVQIRPQKMQPRGFDPFGKDDDGKDD